MLTSHFDKQTQQYLEANAIPDSKTLRNMQGITDWAWFTGITASAFSFQEGVIPQQQPDYCGNFIISGYRCPGCGNRLYKTTFIEHTPQLRFNDITGATASIARIFTCPNCRNFLAAPVGMRLTEGRVIGQVFPPEENSLYQMWLTVFNYLGTFNGKRNE